MTKELHHRLPQIATILLSYTPSRKNLQVIDLKGVNGRLLIRNDDQLKRRKVTYTATLHPVTSYKVAPLTDDMTWGYGLVLQTETILSLPSMCSKRQKPPVLMVSLRNFSCSPCNLRTGCHFYPFANVEILRSFPLNGKRGWSLEL